MKKIKLKFVDMWNSFSLENSFLYNAFLDSGYPVELSDEPDYLVYSVFGHEHLKEKYDNCIKILRTGEAYTPDFNLCDYAIGLDPIQFGDRYTYFPAIFMDDYNLATQKMKLVEEKGKDLSADLSKKNEFCSFVYSNQSTAHPMRLILFQEISKYQPVRSGGRFLNSIGFPDGVPDKIVFESTHKFSIACENLSSPRYLSEKIFESFAAHTVPIYWGDPLVKEIFNEKAFICVHDYPTMDALIQRIREVDENDTLYAKMLSEPAFLHPEENIIDFWHSRNTIFIKHILDQPKEAAFRRPRYAYGKYYLQEMRHAFYPTPVKDAGTALTKSFKAAIPNKVKRKIKAFLPQ